MFKLIGTTLFICALSAGAARAQAQDTTATPADRQAQGEQAERDRRQAEQERKEKDRDARREPGSRCSRWKRGKA